MNDKLKSQFTDLCELRPLYSLNQYLYCLYSKRYDISVNSNGAHTERGINHKRQASVYYLERMVVLLKWLLLVPGVVLFAFGGFKLWQCTDAYKLSDAGLRKLTDEQLRTLRESIRLDYASSGNDPAKASMLQSLLFKIDQITGARAHARSGGVGYPVHTEHGYYLSGD